MSEELQAAEFIAGLAKAFARLELDSMVKIREAGERIAARARQFAPVGGEGDPHAGRLRADIGIKGEGVERGMPYVAVGTTAPEGFLEEYGTSTSAAHPFMRPAMAMEGTSTTKEI